MAIQWTPDLNALKIKKPRINYQAAISFATISFVNDFLLSFNTPK